MKLIRTAIFVSTAFLSLQSAANCTRVTSTSSLSAEVISQGYTASSWLGSYDTYNSKSIGLPAVISLSSGSFQPSGTLLASTTLDFLTQSYQNSYSANQILFRCSITDADSLYEMYATNGDNAYTGMYETSEVEGAYYSYVRNVAVRLTNTKTGEYYSRYWKGRQLTRDDWVADSIYIYIPASAFSSTIMELFRIDSTSYYGNASNRYSYAYSQPHGYIAFKGPGVSANVVEGADSATKYNDWYNYWPGQSSLYNTGTTFVRGATCRVNDYPNVVILPSISVSELQTGATSQASFSVSVECESGAKSSVTTSTTSSANVAMGFMVNQPNAVNAATNLGLTTSSGGLTWLLDNNYGSNGVASGVGIKIYDSNSNAMNLLPNLSSFGSGNTRGWYAFKDITSLLSSSSGSDIYSGDFTASLGAISGQPITAGTVNAQLQVVIGFQ